METWQRIVWRLIAIVAASTFVSYWLWIVKFPLGIILSICALLMILLNLLVLPKEMVLWGIEFYQKYVSPYKGFLCAYSQMYKRESCSQAIKKIVQERGIIKGWAAIRRRLQKCREADRLLCQLRKSPSKIESRTQPRVRLLFDSFLVASCDRVTEFLGDLFHQPSPPPSGHSSSPSSQTSSEDDEQEQTWRKKVQTSGKAFTSESLHASSDEYLSQLSYDSFDVAVKQDCECCPCSHPSSHCYCF